MAKDTTIPASEWLAIRAKVAEKIKTGGSEQRENTRERIAEQLITSGYIDIEFLRGELEAEAAAKAAVKQPVMRGAAAGSGPK